MENSSSNDSKRRVIEEIKIQCFSHQGKRPYQEDRLVVIPDFNSLIPGAVKNVKRSFYAIFDGHGGALVSHILSMKFAEELSRHESITIKPVDALHDVWEKMDDIILQSCKEYSIKQKSLGGTNELICDGATATVALLINDEIYVANCGDSSCHYYDYNGKSTCITENHTTSNINEINRCINNGGIIKYKNNYNCCFNTKEITNGGRLYPGGLQVTRSFGDFNSKLSQYNGGISNVIIPDHGQIGVLSLKNVKFVVLGSDGLWDGFPQNKSNQIYNIISTYKKRNNKNECNPEDLSLNPAIIGNVKRDCDIGGDKANNAEILCNKAIKSNSDNTSCIILEIIHQEL